MTHSLKELNKKRKGGYYKDPVEEDFLSSLNAHLQTNEAKYYQSLQPELPHLFVFGAPRSGTTLLTQVLAYGLDLGYISNFVARFWLAPIQGIKLGRSLLKHEPLPSFHSDFGATKSLQDIHEFGYFWRYWLQKESMEGIANASSMEKHIRWHELTQTLLNIQAQFNRPMMYKNIFGSYHMERLTRELDQQALWLYIERDPLDVAMSILNARKKYYSDLNTWWSYAPPNYASLLPLDYWDQIAGQIHYLSKYYEEWIACMEKVQPVVRISYEELTKTPLQLLQRVQSLLENRFGVAVDIQTDPTASVTFRSYGPSREKEIFADRFAKLSST